MAANTTTRSSGHSGVSERAERGSDDDSVATAVNTRFVPRPARHETPLWPDDRVVVFAAIVGG